MRRMGERFLCMLLALLICLSLFPAAAFAEELGKPEKNDTDAAAFSDPPLRTGYMFTLRPMDMQIDATTLSWRLTWKTNFEPHRVKIVREGDQPVVVKTLYQSNYQYDGDGNLYWILPATEGAPGTYHLEAYTGSSVESAYVSSGGFELGASNLGFTRSPSDGAFDYNLLTYTLNWETNFTPLAVRVVKETDHGSVPVWSDPAPRPNMGCYLTASHGPGSYHIEAVFGSLDVFVPSGSFTVSDAQLRFTDQPTDGQIDPETLSYPISWRTSFTPVFVTLNKHPAQGEDTMVGYYVSDLDKAMTRTVDPSEVLPGDQFYLDAYYSFDEYNSAVWQWVRSSYFELDAENLRFVSSPEDCAYDPDTLRTTLAWETNFTPLWVEIVNGDTEEYYMISGVPYGTSMSSDLITNLGVGSFYLRAYYDYETRQYIESDRFEVSDSNLHYTAQPQDALLNYRTGRYHVSWATNFVPMKVYIVNAADPSHLLLIDTEMDAAMSFDFSCSDLGAGVDGQFYIEAVYGYYIHPEDNTSYYSWSVRSETFGLNTSHGFISQPLSGNIDPDTLSYTVSWETNFEPTRIAIHSYHEAPSDSPVRNLDPTATQTEFSWSNVLENNCYVLRVFYRSDGHEFYIDSAPFTIGTESMRFLIFPTGGPIDPETLSFTLRWKTSFTPVKIEICHYGTGGEIFVDDSSIVNLTADCTYQIPAEKMTGADSHFVRAYFGTNIGGEDNRCVISPPFSVDFSPLAFVTQPESGAYDSATNKYIISWATNFSPEKVELCRMQASGTVQAVADFPSFAIPEEYAMPDSLGTGVYFLRAYYTDYHYVSSSLFTVTDGLHAFVTQSAGGQIDLGTLKYTAYWETNFLPEKIEILYYTGDGNTPEPHVLYSQEAALDTAMEYDIGASDAPGTFYIRAWYSEENYILSSGFTVTVEGLIFTEQPYLYEYDPNDGSYCIFWTTSFVPTKIRVVHAAGEGLLNPVEDEVLTVGYDTHGAYLAYVPDGDDTYFIYAFYGEDSRDFVMGSVRLNPGMLDFVVSPVNGQYQEGPAVYPLIWTTNFLPVKVELLRTNGAVLETLTEGMNRTMSYDLPAVAGEGVYVLRAYYAEEAYKQSEAFVVTYPGPMFTVQPKSGSASAGTPHELHWATSFEPTRLELWNIRDTVHTKVGALNEGATALAISYEQALQYQDTLFYLRAWYGEGEEDSITSVGFPVYPRMELGAASLDVMDGCPLPVYQDYDGWGEYTAYVNNAAGSSPIHYRLNFSPRADFTVTLALLDEEGSTLYSEDWDLVTEIDQSGNIRTSGLPNGIFNYRPQERSVEINTTSAALRACYSPYAADHGYRNPELFSVWIEAEVRDGGEHSYALKLYDLHIPEETGDTWIDFDSFTLTTPMGPQPQFPAAAPAISGASADWYAVVMTSGGDLAFPSAYQPEWEDQSIWEYFNPGFWGYYDEELNDWTERSVPDAFYRIFGEGLDFWAEGPANPAPRGPDNYVFGVSAHKLTRAGTTFAGTALRLADLINENNLPYFNSLPGLSSDSWMGYYRDEERPDGWEGVEYELVASVDGIFTVTFADGVSYHRDVSIIRGQDGGWGFHVNGVPYLPAAISAATNIPVDGDITIEPNGELHTGDLVTVTAPAAPGYTFNGWFNGAEPVCSTLAYTFTIAEENTELVASYTPNGEASVTVKLENGASFLYNGQTYSAETALNVPLGTELTLTAADADRVLQWQNASDKLLGRGASLSFTVVSDTSVTLVYRAADGQSFLQFVSDYGHVLSSGVCGANDAVVFPDPPTKFGYTFVKWVFEGTDTEATEAAIRAKLGTVGTITVKPQYTKDENVYTVTIRYSGVDKADDVYDNIPIGMGYTVTAPEIEGAVFQYWTRGETVVGYKQSFFFQVAGDTVLTAIYAEEAATARPVITISELSAVPGSVHKVTGSVTRSIPEGYTLVEHGVLYARDVPGLDEDSFVYGTEGVGRYVSEKTGRDGVVKLNVKVAADDVVVSLRGYMTLIDNSTGNSLTYYTGIVSGSYNTLNN